MHTPHTITSPDRQTRAVIVPSLGFTCIEFVTHVGGRLVSVLDSERDFLTGRCRPGRSGIPILFPFPNRIRHGRFSYRGMTYEVPPPAWFPQTIHGFCLDRPWRVIDSTTHSLTGEFLLSRDAPERRAQWPADARLVVTYSVVSARLWAEITVENPDSVPLPWGFGTHPYFKLPLGNGHSPESCVIRAEAAEQWELDQCFPTGQRVPVPAKKDLRRGWRYGTCPLDDVYTSLTPIHISMEQVIDDPVSQLRMTQRSCEDFRELVLFTPKDRPVICLEPYTCTTDAANLQSQGLDAGWRELAPRENASLWFELEVSPLGSRL
jgi:aldose 1-epimerase